MLEKTNRNKLLKHPVQCNMLPYFACSLDLMWKNDNSGIMITCTYLPKILKNNFTCLLTTKYGMACLAHEINLSITSASPGWKIQYQKNKLFMMTNLKWVEQLTAQRVKLEIKTISVSWWHYSFFLYGLHDNVLMHWKAKLITTGI